MEFVPALAMVTFLWKLVDFFKFVSAKAWRQVVTQLIAWGAGIITVFLFANASQFSHGISIGDTTLDKLGAVPLIVVGLLLTSMASAAVDVKKALDNSDSASVPPLGGPSDG